jgi:hypothetical protein
MITINEYPVFEADQVLTADHLNQLFDYLDEQNRLTRTCLIGIGIVCGLDSYYDTGKINITAGVGVTSMGYLIHFDGGNYSNARAYSLPDSVTTEEKFFYSGIDMWQLFTPDADNPLTIDDEVLTDQIFLQDKVVILLLELDIENLKNCTTNDCDDKGSRAELNVRPLLVNAKDLSTFTYTGFETGKAALPDIVLKRYNVPFKELKSPTDVLNAFYAITDATSLTKIADGYNKAYETFRIMLPGENVNPFINLILTLNNQLNDVKNNKSIFTEYYYDYIDDLIKAYNEFREKGDSLLVECCPDENLFPFHLALCEALGDSRSMASVYRNYFIHSPVFGEQKASATELQQLFARMKLLIANFKLPDIKSATEAIVRITPSEYGKTYLSGRAIPYYYDVSPLLYTWNYEKTKKGKQTKNLSYYAETYSGDDTVIHPLLYELEPYNFFRIEGHIGKNLNIALANILGNKQKFSLPFDVIALNVAANSRITNQNLSKCYFSDLESLYNVLTAELMCKLHEPVCFLSRLPYIDLRQYIALNAAGVKTGATGITGVRNDVNIAGASAGNTSSTSTGPQGTYTTNANYFFATSGLRSMNDLQATMKAATSRKALNALTGIYSAQSQSFIDQMKYIHPYRKGTFLKHFCDPKPIGDIKTVGQYYLETVSASGAAFPKPLDITSSGILDIYTLMNYMYAHVFYFIDCVEELMATILPFYLNNINYSAFEYRYKLLVDEATAFATTMLFVTAYMDSLTTEDTVMQDYIEDAMVDLVLDEMEMITHLCIDEQIRTLLDEYQKRLKQISIERLFSNYTKYHSGVDHKAGVPKG